jgi:alpha-1,3-rhamnosyl/mannosyltransferase
VHLGHLDADVIPALYRRATGMIFPSLFEGFGIPVIEAMASGCPVAASNRSALPEVVDGAGALFDPTDIDAIAAAVDDLAAEGVQRDTRIGEGLARASLFSWERCADAHIRVYQRAASDGL